MHRVPEHGRWAPVLALVLVCAAGPAAADIISHTGNLILGVSTGNVAQVTANGLGIGVASPSANLHVAGNAVVSGGLAVGGTSNTSGSNLHINGSLGFSIQSVSSNTTLSSNTVVLADTSAGNLWLQLPSPTTVPGRVYHIKKTSALNTLSVFGGIGGIDGNENVRLTSSSNGHPQIEVISASNAWWIVAQSDGVTAYAMAASSNLVGWWKLDETSGTTFADSSNYAKTGTIYNTAAGNVGVSGRIGNAVDFDGVDDRIEIADDDLYSFLNGGGTGDVAFSISAWTYCRGASPASCIVAKYDSYSPFRGEWSFSMIPGNLVYFQLLDNGTGNRIKSQSTSTVSLNSWHHVVVTYDGSAVHSGIKAYVDGALFAGTTSLDATYTKKTNRTSPVTIGAALFNGDATYAEFFKGRIDDIRLYNKELSAAEVQTIYNAAP